MSPLDFKVLGDGTSIFNLLQIPQFHLHRQEKCRQSTVSSYEAVPTVLTVFGSILLTLY